MEKTFFNIVSARDKVYDMNLHQLKLKANDKTDEKIATTFEPSNDEGVVNKAFLDEKNYQK